MNSTVLQRLIHANEAHLNLQLTLHFQNVKFNNFYPFNDIETISPRPMLFITEKKHIQVSLVMMLINATEPKELVIIPNAGHVDLYDKIHLIPFDKLEAFFI